MEALLICLFLLSISYTESRCPPEQFDRCLASLQGRDQYDRESLRNVVLLRPSTPVQDMCREYESARQCLAAMKDHCSTEQRIISEMVLGHVQYVCSTLSEYERYSSCISSGLDNACFPDKMRDLFHEGDVCSNLERLRSCRVLMISDHCGADAGTWIEHVMKHGLLRWGDLYGCHFINPDTGGLSRSSSLDVSFISLLTGCVLASLT